MTNLNTVKSISTLISANKLSEREKCISVIEQHADNRSDDLHLFYTLQAIIDEIREFAEDED